MECEGQDGGKRRLTWQLAANILLCGLLCAGIGLYLQGVWRSPGALRLGPLDADVQGRAVAYAMPGPPGAQGLPGPPESLPKEPPDASGMGAPGPPGRNGGMAPVEEQLPENPAYAAGLKAARRGDHEVAIRHLKVAMEQIADAEERARISLLLGHLHFRAGRAGEAIRAGEAALAYDETMVASFPAAGIHDLSPNLLLGLARLRSALRAQSGARPQSTARLVESGAAEAFPYFQKALAQSPGSPVARRGFECARRALPHEAKAKLPPFIFGCGKALTDETIEADFEVLADPVFAARLLEWRVTSSGGQTSLSKGGVIMRLAEGERHVPLLRMAEASGDDVDPARIAQGWREGNILVDATGAYDLLPVGVTELDDARQVRITHGTETLELSAGSKVAKLGGRRITLTVVPLWGNGMLFVPLDLLTRAFDVEPDWSAVSAMTGGGQIMCEAKSTARVLGLKLTRRGKQVTLERGPDALTLNEGLRDAVRSGQAMQVYPRPTSKNGKLFLPFKVVAESFGYSLKWELIPRTVWVVERPALM